MHTPLGFWEGARGQPSQGRAHFHAFQAGPEPLSQRLTPTLPVSCRRIFRACQVPFHVPALEGFFVFRKPLCHRGVRDASVWFVLGLSASGVKPSGWCSLLAVSQVSSFLATCL